MTPCQIKVSVGNDMIALLSSLVMGIIKNQTAGNDGEVS